MTITNLGFGGEIDAAVWGDITSYLGHRFCVRDQDSWKPTAVTSERKVAIAPGVGFGHGVLSTSDSTEVLDLTTPPAGTGQWFLIYARRTWPVDEADGHTEFYAAPAFVTSTVVSGVAPTLVGADGGYLHETPGVSADQPIAWAHVNGTNTRVVIQDLRVVRDNGEMTTSGTIYDTNWRRTLGEETQTYVKRINGEVILHMNLQSQAGAIGNRRGQRICVLPESFRPPQTHVIVATLVDGGAEGLVWLALNNSGELTVIYTTNTTALRCRLEFRFNLTS